MKTTNRPAFYRIHTLFVEAAFLTCTLLPAFFSSGKASGIEAQPLVPDAPGRLPQSIENRPVTPDMGCFWSIKYQPEDQSFASFKPFIDAVGPTNAFDVLSITLRDLTFFADNRAAVDATKEAVEYAFQHYGIRTVLDLDLRIARHDFEKARPDLALERLFFQNQELAAENEEIKFSFETSILTDHYSGAVPYFVRGARLVKAWGYSYGNDGTISPESVVDVTNAARWNHEQYFVANNPGYEIDPQVNKTLEVSFEKSALPANVAAVSVAVAFRYSYPDLFADETMELEKKIYESYRDVPALGGYKDEWGFLPNFNRTEALNEFWYTEKTAQAYASRFDGLSLIDDLFLASLPQSGRDRERVEAVDRYRRLCAERVVEFEQQSYELNKEIWGKDAFVGVHGTWYPWPNILEMRKNGIMWWKAPRDVAQTDEFVPFCIRNSMAKGCGSLWINMFYARQTPNYVTEHWTAAASGGRVHIHQIYPRDENSPKNPLDPKLLPIVEDAGIHKIREKVRMLNLVSNSQIDSPVGVIFGRLGASNPLRPEFCAVGVDICDRLAVKGYPSDLIPIDEIFTSRPDGTPRWTVKDGRLAYGDQKYEALLLYGESDAEKEAWDALRALAATTADCKTQFISVPADADAEAKDKYAAQALDVVKMAGIEPQTPWNRDPSVFSSGEESSVRPLRTTTSRFIDGTFLWIAATENDFGDPIVLDGEQVKLNHGKTSEPISVEANGVFSVRFDDAGKANAVVATEVKSMSVGNLSFTLSDAEVGDAPIDVALWRGENGEWRGVFQRKENNLPDSVAKLAPTWNYLRKR